MIPLFVKFLPKHLEKAYKMKIQNKKFCRNTLKYKVFN